MLRDHPSPRVSSHQPSLWPWAGYWAKVLQSDLHIMTCGVQFDYGGYQNRVPLNGAWLTLPVQKPAPGTPIKDVRFLPEAVPKLRTTVLQALAGKRWPVEGRGAIQWIVSETFDHMGPTPWLLELNMRAYTAVATVLGVQHLTCTRVHDFERPDPDQSKTERLVARIRRHTLVERLSYLAGGGARGYLERAAWPGDWSLRFQSAKEGAAPDTVLSVIARDPGKAKSEILGAFGWEPWSACDQTCSGDLAALR